MIAGAKIREATVTYRKIHLDGSLGPEVTMTIPVEQAPVDQPDEKDKEDGCVDQSHE